MKDVWFAFRLIEGTFSIACMGFHIYGFLYKTEPLNHEMYFCGTFFGFTVISIFTNIGTCMGAAAPLFLEALISGCGCFFFLLSSIMSMHYAEVDFHLMYLSDYEESVHPFFFISKCQSIAALLCGVTYLLHAIFAIDALVITSSDVANVPSKLSNIETIQPIKLYLFCRPWLSPCHCECCDNIACCRACIEALNEDDGGKGV